MRTFWSFATWTLSGVAAVLAVMLPWVSYFLAVDDAAITDPSGAVWSHQALAETMMLINLFAVLPLALLRLRSAVRGSHR